MCSGLLPETLAEAQDTASTQIKRAPAALRLDGNVRLDRSVVPTHYMLDLSIDPNQERFSGRVSILVDIRKPTSLVRLHAQNMRLHSVGVERDGHTHLARTLVGKNGGVALRIDPPLPVGPARLHFSYDAPFSPTLFGLYRTQARGRWYAFTQFQALYARRAFPCFDQPEFKTPYSVILRVPSGQTALANGLQHRHNQAREADTDSAVTIFSFAETQPLPTYLERVAEFSGGSLYLALSR